MKKYLSLLLIFLMLIQFTSFYSFASGECPFTDISGHYAYDAIVNMYEAGIMAGTSETTFSPSAVVTRSAITLVAKTFIGFNVSNSGSSGYSDVASNKYYTGSVRWADQYNLTPWPSGTYTHFYPSAELTREEACYILYRMCEQFAIPLNYTIRSTTFADTDFSDSDYRTACEKLYSAVVVSGTSEEVVGGVTRVYFSPKNPLKRGQLAIMLDAIFSIYTFHGSNTNMPNPQFSAYNSIYKWYPKTNGKCNILAYDMNLSSESHLFADNLVEGLLYWDNTGNVEISFTSLEHANLFFRTTTEHDWEEARDWFGENPEDVVAVTIINNIELNTPVDRTVSIQYATIVFNPNADDFTFYPSISQTNTVAHEIGHALSLAHPYMDYPNQYQKAVMRQGLKDFNNLTYYDIQTFNERYGY